MSSHIDTKLVKDAADKLAEHYDSVHIFVTLNDCVEKEIRSYDVGVGNVHATLGVVQEFLDIRREYARCYARRKDKENDL